MKYETKPGRKFKVGSSELWNHWFDLILLLTRHQWGCYATQNAQWSYPEVILLFIDQVKRFQMDISLRNLSNSGFTLQ